MAKKRGDDHIEYISGSVTTQKIVRQLQVGEGILHEVIFNTVTAGATIIITDTDGVVPGKVIASFTQTATPYSCALQYGAKFDTGLKIEAVGLTEDITVVWA